jgi:predicted RNA-binding protein with TRAM domain
LIGPGAARLRELEAMTKRRFFLEGKPDTHLDHFVVLAEGKLADLAPTAPFEEGAELQVELGEVDRHDGTAAVGKLDGFDVCVAEAASLVGKRVKVRIERVLDGVAYATLVRRAGKQAPEPLTAEAEAEKPTRKPPARKTAHATPGQGDDEDEEEPEEEEASESGEDVAEPVVAEAEPASVDDPEVGDGPEVDDIEAPVETAGAAPAKKKTRRGSRGGKNRKKPAGAPEAPNTEAPITEAGAPEAGATREIADAAPPEPAQEIKRPVTIHVPSDELGREGEDEDAPEAEQQPSENGAAPVKKKTRRGSRGGKNRRKRTAAAGTGANGAQTDVAQTEIAQTDLAETNGEAAPAEQPEEAVEAAAPHEEPVAVIPEPVSEAAKNGDPDEDWGYVPMSEWGDELK